MYAIITKKRYDNWERCLERRIKAPHEYEKGEFKNPARMRVYSDLSKDAKEIVDSVKSTNVRNVRFLGKDFVLMDRAGWKGLKGGESFDKKYNKFFMMFGMTECRRLSQRGDGDRHYIREF